MKLRKKLFPKSTCDFTCLVFLLLMFQVCYWFEVFVVLPIYYEANDFMYWFNCVVSTILMFNVVGNFVAVYLVDTSIEGRIIPSTLKKSWKFCEVCECITPPRSWHCNVCEKCILKRDHHCNFIACCIGHYNHRYFIAFLMYLSISTLYCSYFNAYYLWRFTTLKSIYGFLKLIFPLAVFVFGSDFSQMQFNRLICVITIVGMFAAITVFVYNLTNVMQGVTMYEKGKKINDYNLGDTVENMKQVFGKRWYLIWISPFIESKLPHDGIHWDKLKCLSEKYKWFIAQYITSCIYLRNVKKTGNLGRQFFIRIEIWYLMTKTCFFMILYWSSINL